MELTIQFWYLLPISIAIATIAMSSGIGGAVFFSPLFMIGLGLEPNIAIGAALATELFGFGSGLVFGSPSGLGGPVGIGVGEAESAGGVFADWSPRLLIQTT